MSFSYYSPIPVDHTKVPSTQTNFTVLIKVTDARFKVTGSGGHVQNSSGFDIRPYSDTGLTSALTYELENYVSTTGEIEMWVKIASLSSTVDTPIYLAYGDAALNTDGSSTGAWDSSFVVVYHLKEATGSNPADSTANALALTQTASPVQGAGQIDGSLAFNGTTQWLTRTNPALLNFDVANAFSASFWAKPNAFTGTREFLVCKILGTSPFNGWCFSMDGYGNTNTTGILGIDLVSSTSGSLLVNTSAATNMHDGNWHLYHYTYDGSNTPAGCAIYEDGVSKALFTTTNTLTGSITSTANFKISGNNANVVPYGGSLDEIRVSSVVRTQNWITTEWNNQSSPGTFSILGSETATASGGVIPPAGTFFFSP
jgi:concanavalin A-like lectin/glucanase superfamily protein